MPSPLNRAALSTQHAYPRVHVWSGEVDRLSLHWQQRQRLDAAAPIVVHDGNFPHRILLSEIDQQFNWQSISVAAAADRLGRPRDSWSRVWRQKSDRDRQLALALLPPSADRDAIEFLCSQPLDWYHHPSSFDLAWLNIIQDWIAPHRLPSLLYLANDWDRFSRASHSAVPVAFQAPALHQTIITTPAVWERFSASATNSRFDIILKENHRSFDLPASIPDARRAPANHAAVALSAANHPPLLARHPTDAPIAYQSPDSPLPPATANGRSPETECFLDRARSAAEQQIFDWLQQHPVTRNLFRLNNRLPITFGNRPMEVDLLCESLKIAIEVDGWFHFQDVTAYRRDRAKDWLLQSNGYWVLRFATEDIPARRNQIQQRILDTIDSRQPNR